MNYLAVILISLCFMIALRFLGIISTAAGVIENARAAFRLVGDREVSDADKERLLQKASVSMMGSFISMTLRSIAAITASLLPLFVFDLTGLARFSTVTHLLATWQGVVLTGVVMASVQLVKVRR